VYDPAKRVYKNVPTAQQPAKQPQKWQELQQTAAQ
jgi:hypothetical protein